MKALGISRVALKHALWRLARAGRVAAPRRGFYVIVPPEYRVARCPPADWFIHDLMAYLGRPYYVGLLTAAALHGAAHQAPQEFQVLSDRPLPMIEIGRVRIRFVKKAHLKATPTIRVNTQTGQIHVSTPAATAFDLVRYPEHCGFLSNVATVLHDLVERLDGGALAQAAEVESEVAYAQRLGYLLELVGRAEPAGPLADWVATKAPRIVPLDPSQAMTGARETSGGVSPSRPPRSPRTPPSRTRFAGCIRISGACTTRSAPGACSGARTGRDSLARGVRP